MTDHPCKGMTKAQTEVFERIAINQPAAASWKTMDVLLKAGVVECGQSEMRRDAMGVYEIPSFFVPIHVHYKWCQWASEQELG